MPEVGAILWQSFRLPPPTLTEENLPDQAGKVHIITGGYAGCGEELAKIFYSKNATVYVAGRSKSKADAAISRIKAASPNSTGRVWFLALDLADLTTVKRAAEEFISKESRLDTLTNNAGVMNTPNTEKTVQGHELQHGTNCLGPWLFTQHLLPILRKTAAIAPKGSVRVTWAASLGVWFSPTNGVDFDPTTNEPKIVSKEVNYTQTKAGNVYLASEFARRYSKDGIISVSWNPGNLSTELQRHVPYLQNLILGLMLFPAKFGACTELYAACSPDITETDNGGYIAPWGRKMDPRLDVKKQVEDATERGTGTAVQFWEWCEKATKDFR